MPLKNAVLALAATSAGAFLMAQPAHARLNPDDAQVCRIFAFADHALSRIAQKNPSMSEEQKDESTPGVMAATALVSTCNSPSKAPKSAEICRRVHKFDFESVSFQTEIESLTDRPQTVCTRELLDKKAKAEFEKSYANAIDLIQEYAGKVLKAEVVIPGEKPSSEEVCEKLTHVEPRKDGKIINPELRPGATTKALETAFSLGNENLLLSPKDAAPRLHQLGFEDYKPGVKITDQGDVPDAAIFVIVKNSGCPVPETGHLAVKCGANRLFWRPGESKDLNVFLKENAHCISSIQVRSETTADPAELALEVFKPKAESRKVQ